MDTRTTQVLEALDGLSLDLLIELLGGSATEASLVENVAGGASQPTVHRRLTNLARSGLVQQAPGTPHEPGREWRAVAPKSTGLFIEALLELTDALEAADRSKRKAAQQRLRRARQAASIP